MSIHDLIKSIPLDATTIKKDNWEELLLVEFRYRLLNIPGQKPKIEITKKLPHNNKRKYLLASGEWIYYQLKPFYETYVTHTYYSYKSLNEL